MRIDACVRSNIGLVRRRNEDNFYFSGDCMETGDNSSFSRTASFSADHAVFAVCDGMGGFNDGDEASLTGVSSLKDSGNSDLNSGNMKEHLRSLILKANDAVCSLAKDRNKRIGSTMAVAEVFKGKMIVGNIGDSRIYELCGNEFSQLTVDHTEVQRLLKSGMITEDEARKNPLRNRLTQHLGMPSVDFAVEPFISSVIELKPGAKYIICSDGLYSMIESDIIKEIMQKFESAEEICRVLEKYALDGGGKDNITVISLHICNETETDKKSEPASGFITKDTVKRYLILLAVIALLLLLGIVFMSRIIPDEINSLMLVPARISIFQNWIKY